MSVLACLLRETKTRYLQSRYARPVSLGMKPAIVSFTFDDVPRTAFTNGVPLLIRLNQGDVLRGDGLVMQR